MKYKHNKNLVSNAKQLRKEMTKEERRLRRATGFCVAKAWGIVILSEAKNRINISAEFTCLPLTGDEADCRQWRIKGSEGPPVRSPCEGNVTK